MPKNDESPLQKHTIGLSAPVTALKQLTSKIPPGVLKEKYTWRSQKGKDYMLIK
jgi:hypothetical protein